MAVLELNNRCAVSKKGLGRTRRCKLYLSCYVMTLDPNTCVKMRSRMNPAGHLCLKKYVAFPIRLRRHTAVATPAQRRQSKTYSERATIGTNSTGENTHEALMLVLTLSWLVRIALSSCLLSLIFVGTCPQGMWQSSRHLTLQKWQAGCLGQLCQRPNHSTWPVGGVGWHAHCTV